MADERTPPKVFISYSHDSAEHKRWVLELAEELQNSGVDCLFDAWELRPGDDVPKFMEKSVRDSDRVLMICTKNYVAKANDGVGGVGYEAMIVTGELVHNLGTTKFIPLIRQAAGEVVLPTSVSTRMWIDLRDDGARASRMKDLIRELHDVRPRKPPLGPSPFSVPHDASAQPGPGALHTAAEESATGRPVMEVYRTAIAIAQIGDILKWRKLVVDARSAIPARLQEWTRQYAQLHPQDIDTLIQQSMEGVEAFAPLIAIALAGVTSGNERMEAQTGLLEDILNPKEWTRSGFVARVELPSTGAFVYQALLGATCLYARRPRLAIDLARCATRDHRTGQPVQLYARHDLVGWPESLGKNAAKTWETALSLAQRWPWLREIFTSDKEEYEASLYAYYVTLTFVEFVECVLAKRDFSQDPYKTGWWPDVPVFFELVDETVKRRGYALVTEEIAALRAWLAEVKADERQLRDLWPTWIGLHERILASERPFWRNAFGFANLVPDILNR